MKIFSTLILALTICVSCKKSNDPQPEAQPSKRISKVVAISPIDTVIYTPFYGLSDRIDSIKINRINFSPSQPQPIHRFRDLVEFTYENGKLSSRKYSGGSAEFLYYDNNNRISSYVVGPNAPIPLMPLTVYDFYYHPNGELHYLKKDNKDSLHVYNISPKSRSIKTYLAPVTIPGPGPQPICIPEISLSINADLTYNYINTSPYGCVPMSTPGKYSNLKINIPYELWHELKDITNSLYDNGYYPYALPELLFKDMDENFIVEMETSGVKNEYKVDQFGRLLEINRKYESQPGEGKRIFFYY